ncbi:hypothetical protein F5X97DRAFT_309073 [Nemania serpens]|nr:hypothetical protein F5X97DRAFT_309073 [Nemania serpens]
MPRVALTRPLVHQLALPYLLVAPVVLAVLAAVVLTVHGDVNTPLLYSQCHSRSRLPAVSRIPVLGAPACFLVSSFVFAAASARGVAELGVFLAFVGALLTACRVEAARACNRRSWHIRMPTLSWLAFSLVGGTFVWDLWIVPAFIKHARDLKVERAKVESLETGQAGGDVFGGDEELIVLERSFVTRAEVYAIPLAVAIGFLVPSILMLVLKDAVSVVVWLFFPLWVATVYRAVKLAAVRLLPDNGPLYLESNPPSVAMVYAVPFIASLLAHGFFIWNLFCEDHSRQMTRTVLKFIQIDFIFMAATVLYWVLVEAGAIPVVLMVAFSVLLGPGAALCLTWLIRERAICAFAVEREAEVSDEESDGDDSTVHEETPLLN